MPSDIRTEHSLHIFQIHQRLLGQGLPDFVFVYLHFSILPTEIIDLVTEMHQMKIVIDIERSFVYIAAFIRLVCVQLVIWHSYTGRPSLLFSTE